VLACLGSAQARELKASELEQPSHRDVVVANNRGWRVGLSPGLLISVRDEPLSFAFGGDLRHGFELGRIVLAPGLRLGARLFSKPRVFSSFATLRLTLPVGRVGPYLLAGVGGGWIDRPAFGYLGGGGFLVHIGTHFGIGAEATFQSLIYSSYKVVAVGPQVLFAF
jgi:hypothetical protein